MVLRASIFLLASTFVAHAQLTPEEERFLEKPSPLLNWWDLGKYLETAAKKPPAPRSESPVFVRAAVTGDDPWQGVLALSDVAIGRRFFKGRAWIIGADGAVAFDDARKNPDSVKPLSRGVRTPWIDLTDAFTMDRVQIIDLVAFRDMRMVLRPDDTAKWVRSASFRVEFSRTPSKSGVFGVFERSGPGIQMCGLVSRKDGMAVSDAKAALFDLERARAAAKEFPGDEVRPRRFHISMSKVAGIRAERCSAASVGYAAETLRLLGVNDFGGSNPALDACADPGGKFMPELVGRDPGGSLNPSRITCGCPCTINHEAITNNLRRLAENWKVPLAAGRRIMVSIADEYGLGFHVMTNCASTVKNCRERFREYLAANKVSPRDLGRASMKQVDFSYDHSEPFLFYWTMRYRTELVRRMFLAVSDAARAIAPGMQITCNVGIELVFGGNAVKGAMDPFELISSGAIMHGLTEDWSNLQYTYQFCSYVCDVWRSASERCGKRFSILSVMKQDEFQTAAKAFSETGHGSEGIPFFAWGPTWTGGGDCRNQCQGVYPALRTFAKATSAAEDILVDGKVARGDAALLFSVTGDYHELLPVEKRSWIEQNPYGKDRMSVSLILNHCGVRTDILCEDDLENKLSGYPVLFVTDRSVRRDAADVIRRWVENGGILVKTPAALTADERQHPLKPLTGSRVHELGFAPWKDYLVASKFLDGSYSHREFPEEVRRKMRSLCRAIGLRSRLRTDHPLVEASLIESPHGAAVVLANWTLSRRATRVGLRRPPEFDTLRRATGAPCKWSMDRDVLCVDLDLASGDYLILEKKK